MGVCLKGLLLNFEEVIFHYQRVAGQSFLKDSIRTQIERKRVLFPRFFLYIGMQTIWMIQLQRWRFLIIPAVLLLASSNCQGFYQAHTSQFLSSEWQHHYVARFFANMRKKLNNELCREFHQSHNSINVPGQVMR